jgi:chromate transporter
MESRDEERGKLGDLALAFLRLGFTAFGGPAAHLAMMEEEFVRRRRWLTHDDLLDMIGAAILIPGPNSTEVAIHIGLRRAGVWGLLIAGACFIVPAALLVAAFAWVYVRYGSLPSFTAALYGIKPVVVAVVGQALWQLAPKATNTWPKRGAVFVTLATGLLGAPELVLLFGSGLVLAALGVRRERSLESARPLGRLLALVAGCATLPLLWQALAPQALKATAASIFLYFLKVGSVLYGSGYVLLAFLEGDLVGKYHWLTKGQLLDSVAVGQFTPGPVFTTATFVGYLKGGPLGAFVATVGIFLPSFFFVAVSGKLIPRLRRSPIASDFLDGVNAAALSLMALVLFRLFLDAVRDVPTAILMAGSLVALLRFRVNSAYLILVGAMAGIAIHQLHLFGK